MSVNNQGVGGRFQHHRYAVLKHPTVRQVFINNDKLEVFFCGLRALKSAYSPLQVPHGFASLVADHSPVMSRYSSASALRASRAILIGAVGSRAKSSFAAHKGAKWFVLSCLIMRPDSEWPLFRDTMPCKLVINDVLRRTR